MMTYTLPTCRLCAKEVESSISTVKDIFTAEGRQQVLHSVTLSCGCVIDYPEFDVDMKGGTQTLKSFTGEPVLTYHDPEYLLGDDEDDYEDED